MAYHLYSTIGKSRMILWPSSGLGWIRLLDMQILLIIKA